ncbi:AAL118Cp [Eremothecium gossypii ATCC 10895]|uniref:Tubulin-specific chaperone A n=1 Tax=Eremothecium gossypii (strain ATCC 10895 / CBS 109.51 / FGSC 9923 / NRRL Y-1056) TaxID=284811 RepID=Q75F46_EREGS|nr:AAL118Cp [Eremothecium gossypii ATCC 10895]AAS50248.1 AAL118Cp [Eremothecium gossypii ATCC 10895]AEY94533.1 FAAL118Cp [Eremothecium gossypii FDAG1]
MAPTQLEIKVRALQRLIKEEKYYQDELREQRERVELLKRDASVDPYELKKQIEVMQDTERLLPRFYEKVQQFYNDLKDFVNGYNGDEDTADAHNALKLGNDLLASRK